MQHASVKFLYGNRGKYFKNKCAETKIRRRTYIFTHETIIIVKLIVRFLRLIKSVYTFKRTISSTLAQKIQTQLKLAATK